MLNFQEFWLDGHLEDVRITTNVQQVFGLDVAVCVVHEPPAPSTLDGSDFKTLFLLIGKIKTKNQSYKILNCHFKKNKKKEKMNINSFLLKILLQKKTLTTNK